MSDIVEVTISIEAEYAAALSDARVPEAIGRVVSRMLRPRKDDDPLITAMDRLSAEAQRHGLAEA